jgi:hypothetical protein
MASTWKKLLDIDPSFWYNGVMKVGDLVLCTWQPTVRSVINNIAEPMSMQIKGKLGIILDYELHRYAIAFPGCAGYVHWLASSAFEVLNENR